MLGVVYDPSCSDPSRLMYTPRIASEADQRPLAFAIRPMVKLPTGSTNDGVSSGKADFLVDAVASKTNTLTNGTVNLADFGTTTTDYYTGYTPSWTLTSASQVTHRKDDIAAANTPGLLGATANNYLGKSQYNDPYFNGSINEFRIYNTALSAAQIATSFANGPDGTPP